MVVIFQTQADWQSGSSSQNIDTTTVPGHLKADFSSTSAEVNSNWIQNSELANWICDSRTVVNTIALGYMELGYNGSPGIVPLQCWRANTTGSGRWDVGLATGGSAGMSCFIFMAQNVNPSTLIPLSNYPGNTTTDYYALYHGYCVRFDTTQNYPNPIRVFLQRMDANATFSTTLASTTITNPGATTPTVTVVRYPTGLMKVSINGTQVLSATDTTYTTGNYIGFAAYQTNFLVAQNSLYKPSASFLMYWASPPIDTSVSSLIWKNRIYVLSGSTGLQLGGVGNFSISTGTDPSPTGGGLQFAYPVKPNQVADKASLGVEYRYERIYIGYQAVDLPSNNDPDITKVIVGLPLKSQMFLA